MLPDRLSRLLILISAGMSFASPGQALTLNEALAIRLATPNETTRSGVAARSHSDSQQHRASPAELLAKLQEEGTSVLVLEKTHRRLPSTGDPVWSLRLEIPGQPVRQFDAVSGRANRQGADRDRLGSRAPLPAGR